VTWPILTQAVRGEAVTVGRGYYDFFLRSFGLPLLLLMGVGPLIAWRRASLRSLGRTFLWPLGAAVLAGIGLAAAGGGSSLAGMLTYTFSAFVLASIVLEFVRGTRARRAVAGGSWLRAFGELVGRNRRRYGGYVVHAAVVLLAIGIAGSAVYASTAERKLAPGQSMAVGGYTLVYRGLTQERQPNHLELRANMDVYRDGRLYTRLSPGKNRYFAEQQTSSEMGIHTNWLRAEDLDVITDQIDATGTVYFRVLVKPLINLIWLAGIVFLIGSLVTLWPDAREQQRLADRYLRRRGPVPID
jgi:cytochrome c-type biogenesis protein CcmF